MIIKFWEVSVMADCEGRTSKVIARLTNQEAAVEFAESDEGRNCYGQRGHISPKNFVIHETAAEAGAKEKTKRREEALAKLSESDKNALGLT
jgi:hypothetical protein